MKSRWYVELSTFQIAVLMWLLRGVNRLLVAVHTPTTILTTILIFHPPFSPNDSHRAHYVSCDNARRRHPSRWSTATATGPGAANSSRPLASPTTALPAWSWLWLWLWPPVPVPSQTRSWSGLPSHPSGSCSSCCDRDRDRGYGCGHGRSQFHLSRSRSGAVGRRTRAQAPTNGTREIPIQASTGCGHGCCCRRRWWWCGHQWRVNENVGAAGAIWYLRVGAASGVHGRWSRARSRSCLGPGPCSRSHSIWRGLGLMGPVRLVRSDRRGPATGDREFGCNWGGVAVAVAGWHHHDHRYCCCYPERSDCWVQSGGGSRTESGWNGRRLTGCSWGGCGSGGVGKMSNGWDCVYYAWWFCHRCVRCCCCRLMYLTLKRGLHRYWSVTSVTYVTHGW